MIEKVIKIKAAQGIHARPASQVVTSAQKFKSDVFLIHNNNKINAKSIMHVLGGGIASGDTITVRCEGVDETAAVESLVSCIESIG